MHFVYIHVGRPPYKNICAELLPFYNKIIEISVTILAGYNILYFMGQVGSTRKKYVYRTGRTEVIMGILTRFKDIMSSNINALLDKCEDPEKMIDQYMRNLESDLGKVKAETASVMAEETRAKRELDECTEQVNKMQSYAEKALKAGNEADARTFLEKKQQLVSTQNALKQSYDIAAANAAKMRQMHDKLVKDIESLESRRAAIKAKVKTAKAQERINSVGSSVLGANNSMEAFNRMEEKANRMLDEANAMAELNQSQADADIDSLTAKYDAEPANTAVDDELAALKAQMGL